MNPNELNLTKAAYSVSELLETVPIGRTSVYAAIRDGKLKAKKFGRKTVFLAPDITAFLNSLSAKNNGGNHVATAS